MSYSTFQLKSRNVESNRKKNKQLFYSCSFRYYVPCSHSSLILSNRKRNLSLSKQLPIVSSPADVSYISVMDSVDRKRRAQEKEGRKE